MRATLIAFVLFSSSLAAAQPAAPPADWKAWRSLLGTWVADATPDGGTGSFTLRESLQGRILVRENYAEYAKTKDHPASRHDDLMVVWQDGATTRADYWDNEGHVIHYTAQASADNVTFLSDAHAGAPRFRLVYTLTSPTTLALEFAIAPPNAPDKFKPYIKATLHKK
jgi:hypothetical protein